MKWIIALLVSALMFFIGYHHAARYVQDDDAEPTPDGIESPPAETDPATPAPTPETIE